MKKFSEFNKTNGLEESKTKQDFITSLIEETLHLEDGVIKGKDILVETLNNIIKMNDHKTTINILENIKVLTYNGGLNFTWLNEAIETEKTTLNNLMLERNKTTETENEIVNENLMGIMNDLMFGFGMTLTAGFAGTIAYLAGSGIYELLIKDSKLGNKGKEFVNKLKELAKKSKTMDKEDYAIEVNKSIEQYSDVIEELKSGEFGKDGEKLASNLETIKKASEEVPVGVNESVNIINEDDKINENLWVDYVNQLNAIPDLFTQIMWSLGILLGTVTVTGFVGSILTLVGMGVSETKVGEKLKEMVGKFKELYKKKDDKKIDKENFAKEVKETIDEYSDVVDEIKTGKLGKKVQVMGKLIDKVKENAEKLEKEEVEIKESLFYRGYNDQHLMELESLKSIYTDILKENKNEDNI